MSSVPTLPVVSAVSGDTVLGIKGGKLFRFTVDQIMLAPGAQAIIQGLIGQAQDAMAGAQAAQSAAEAARDAANTSGKVFTSAEGTAAGLAATTSGQSFSVLAADLKSWSVYKNNAGAAVFLASNYTKAYIDAQFSDGPLDPNYVPLFEDDAGNVPLWLEQGLLGAIGLTQALINSMAGSLSTNQTMVNAMVANSGLVAVASDSVLVPLFVDENDNVPVWLANGYLDSLGLGPVLVGATQAAALQVAAPRSSPASSNLPIFTDGRSLYAWRAKLAQLQRAGTGQVKVMTFGDSWAQKTNIPQQLATLLYGLYGKAQEGWITVDSAVDSQMNGVAIASAGWTQYNASTAIAPTFGCGVDGHALSTTSAAATFSVTGLTTTDLDIYYRKGDGTFRYRIDGGAWTAVTGDGTNALGKVSLTGLANAAHTLEIDTTGNAGTAVLYGMRASRPAVPGIVVQKCGSSGIRGADFPLYVNNPEFTQMMADLMPDAVLMPISTNDASSATGTMTAFKAGIAQVVSQIRSVSPNTGFIFVAPALNSRVNVTPQSSFRDAIYQFCIANGHEFYNMQDDWSDWNTMNALGVWADNSHVSANGGLAVARRVNTRFLTI